jgi:16S rRNA (guanine527-N7)-methyltransferase
MQVGFDRRQLGQLLAQGVQALGLPLSEAGRERLLDYTALLVKWNRVYNLTAVRDPSSMITQHLLDSLAAVPAVAHAKRLLDVGAGGGLPGLVFAIYADDQGLPMQVSMIDTVHKKTAFLTQVQAQLGLKNVHVYTGRVEQLSVADKFDVITSRAFAELKDFIEWSAHLLEEGGCFLALKGVMPEQEIANMPLGWRVSAVTPLDVPGLEAQRHLVRIERQSEGAA